MKNNHYSKYSPNEILEIFKEQHRMTSPLDPMADESFTITKETLIIDLQDAQDLLPWKEWTKWLNQCYKIKAKQSDWKKVIKPVTKKTLWHICIFISERAKKEEIKPITLFGNECLSSAIFLTLKRNMKKKGAHVEHLKPSTIISEFLHNERNFSPFLEEVTLTGVKTFETFTLEKRKRKFNGCIDEILQTIMFKQPLNLNTGDLVTFKDLINKIIERKYPESKER